MKNKRTLIITSLVILLPTFFGIIYWNQLPEKVALQFNFFGEVGSYRSRKELVFYLPALYLSLHLFIMICSEKDKKFMKLNGKLQSLTFWSIPFASIFGFGMVYAINLGIDINTNFMLILLLSMFLIVSGNYLPKYKKDNAIGIKNRWTMKSDIVWQKTHRFIGELWIAIGLFLLIFFIIKGFTFYSFIFLIFEFIVVVFIVPNIYSYYIYKKEKDRNN